MGIENDEKGLNRIKNNEEYPYWKYNDIIGFIEIGSDGGDYITSEIFLKRKHLPTGHVNKRIGNTTIQNHQFYYYTEVTKIRVDISSNYSIIRGLKQIIADTDKIVKRMFPKSYISEPELSFSNIDFVNEIRSE